MAILLLTLDSDPVFAGSMVAYCTSATELSVAILQLACRIESIRATFRSSCRSLVESTAQTLRKSSTFVERHLRVLRITLGCYQRNKHGRLSSSYRLSVAASPLEFAIEGGVLAKK